MTAVVGCSPSGDGEAIGGDATETQATGTDTPNGESAGDRLVVGVPEEIPTLDPQAREFYGIRAITDWNLYEALLKRDESGELKPFLAEEMPQRIDDTTWQFKLREGIEFSNGEPFDAESAAASINRIIDPDYGSEKLGRLDTIAGAEAADGFTLEVTTVAPDPILPSRIELIMMVPLEASQEEDFGESPAGTGPYNWVSGIGGGPIVLEENPNYWGDVDPHISEVEFRVIPDVSTQISALQANEIDLLMRLGPDAAAAVPQVLTAPGLENNVVTLNSTAGVTSDPRVRQALNYAVDKAALAEDLWSGYADVAQCQAVAPSAFGYADGLEAYEYDPERARALLEEAGVLGETIELVTADGVFPLGREMGEVVAANWEAVGLSVDLQVPEFDPYLDALYAKGEDRPAGVYLSTTTELSDADSVVQRIYVSTADATGYENPDVDEIAQRAAQELESSERADMYREVLELGCEDPVAVFLLTPQEIYGASERLNFEPRADAKILLSEMSLD